TRNVIEARASVAAGMRARVDFHRKADSAPAGAAAPGLDADAAERLAALGYVGSASFLGKPSGADPKDKLAGYPAYAREAQRGLQACRERNFDEAIRILSRLSTAASVERGGVIEQRSFPVEYNLGRSLLEKQRYGEAVPHLEAAVTMDPAYVPARLVL